MNSIDLRALVSSGRQIVPVLRNKQPRVPLMNIAARTSLAWLEPFGPPYAQMTGEPSGLLTLDFDGPAGLALLEHLKLTPHRTTPHGAHVDVTYPGYTPKLDRVDGLDVLGDRRYAVVLGEGYKWIRGVEPIRFDDLPAKLWLMLLKGGRKRCPTPD